MGLLTTSTRPLTYCGTPRRTGMWNTSSASSMAPSILELPPVSTMPVATCSSNPARRPIAHARHFDGLVGIRQLRQGAGVLDLDVLGVLRGRAHGHGDVIGHLIAGDGDHRRVTDRAAAEHGDVGGAAAD